MKGWSLWMSELKYTLENLYWHLNTAGLLCAHQNSLALSPRHLRNHTLLINSKQMDFFFIIFQKLASVPHLSSTVTCNFIFFPKLQYKYDIKWKDTFQFNIYKLILTNFNWLLNSVWTGCKWKIVGIYLQCVVPVSQILSCKTGKIHSTSTQIGSSCNDNWFLATAVSIYL